jgi:hypothetical protein
MALIDYWLCDVCECKTFYDAPLAYDRHNPTRHDGAMLPAGAGDMRAICVKCAETYVVEVRRREGQT